VTLSRPHTLRPELKTALAHIERDPQKPLH